MREETDARRVPDRPDAVAGRQAIVDGHAPLRDLDAELLEPEPFDARLAAGRDEQALRVDRLTRREVKADSARSRLDAVGPGLDENADPVLLEPLGEQRAGVRIESSEEMLACARRA